jgi:organic hydroperoxide reductase OsmC/OhrA
MNYTAVVQWKRKDHEAFIDNRYSRAHQWIFDGGARVKASSSPQVVRLPMSDETAVDPEEALVASVSSCHMLFFLSYAAAQKFIIESYEDHAEGLMKENSDGKIAMESIILKPIITFSGPLKPDDEQIKLLHKKSHDDCYIANSLKTSVTVEQLPVNN